MSANLLTMLLCCNAGFALASAAKVDVIVWYHVLVSKLTCGNNKRQSGREFSRLCWFTFALWGCEWRGQDPQWMHWLKRPPRRVLPGMQSITGLDKGWMFDSHASRPCKCVPHCQRDKNSLLDETFQGPGGLCERGTLALLCFRWWSFKSSDFISQSQHNKGKMVMDFSMNYRRTPRSLSLHCVFPLVRFISHVKISNKPRRRRKWRVGAVAVFIGQKPPGSAGGLKPTSRLPSVDFEM